MIHPDSRSLEWIKQVAAENRFNDYALVEKTIRAFSLLEALVKSGCPFIFKGGTSMSLVLSPKMRNLKFIPDQKLFYRHVVADDKLYTSRVIEYLATTVKSSRYDKKPTPSTTKSPTQSTKFLQEIINTIQESSNR